MWCCHTVLHNLKILLYHEEVLGYIELTSTSSHFGRQRRKMCVSCCICQKHFSDFGWLCKNLDSLNRGAVKFLVYSFDHLFLLMQKLPTNKNVFIPLNPHLNLVLTWTCFHCAVVDHNEGGISLLCRSDLLKSCRSSVVPLRAY